MDWARAFAIAIGIVLAVAYGIRATVTWRAGNAAWRRWALIAVLFAIGVALVVGADLLD